MALDGVYVCEAMEVATLEIALDRAENIGSRWIHYPIPVIIKNGVIVHVPYVLQEFKGCTKQELSQWLGSLTSADRSTLQSSI